jgi:hypothetical protein
MVFFSPSFVPVFFLIKGASMNVVRPRMIRFGVFEVDLNSGELFKDGHEIRIEDQLERY